MHCQKLALTTLGNLTDILVMNTGLHYHLHGVHEDYKLTMDLIFSTFTAQASPKSEDRLKRFIWMETRPQHFHSQDGAGSYEWSHEYKAGVTGIGMSNLTMEWTKDQLPKDIINNTINGFKETLRQHSQAAGAEQSAYRFIFPCASTTNPSKAQTGLTELANQAIDRYNTTSLLQQAGHSGPLRVMRVRDLLMPHCYLHRGMKPGNTPDCSHYMIPPKDTRDVPGMKMAEWVWHIFADALHDALDSARNGFAAVR